MDVQYTNQIVGNFLNINYSVSFCVSLSLSLSSSLSHLSVLSSSISLSALSLMLTHTEVEGKVVEVERCYDYESIIKSHVFSNIFI